MKRPKLRQMDLKKISTFLPGMFSITMSLGQWDSILQSFYDSGAILIELDNEQKLVAAYKK